MPITKAGQRLTAATLNAAIGLTARKSADLGRPTSTTLTADPDLAVTVLANSAYLVTFSLLYKGAATNTGDLKFSFSAPSGATFAGGFLGITNPLALYITPVTVSSTQVSYTNGTGNPLWCQVTATLVTSAAGSFALTWAQNTSSATATTLMAGSSLRAAQV